MARVLGRFGEFVLVIFVPGPFEAPESRSGLLSTVVCFNAARALDMAGRAGPRAARALNVAARSCPCAARPGEMAAGACVRCRQSVRNCRLGLPWCRWSARNSRSGLLLCFTNTELALEVTSKLAVRRTYAPPRAVVHRSRMCMHVITLA